MTAESAARFKAKPRTVRAKVGEAGRGARTLSPAETSQLAKIRSAILPEPQSPAIWSLMKLPVKPPVLTWEQVAGLQAADVRKYPVLFYLGSEIYRPTVRQAGDVDAGLLRWLHAGGTLVVLPSGPMPFHYDPDGNAVARSGKFGLPLSVAGRDGGWEQPPPGVRLRFTQVDKRLPHVPAEFPFPSSVDPRWRPFVRSQMDSGDLVVPLVELRDGQGKHYGDAVVYAEYKSGEPRGGRVAYVWFSLLDVPQGEALLDDLLLFVAAKLTGG